MRARTPCEWIIPPDDDPPEPPTQVVGAPFTPAIDYSQGLARHWQVRYAQYANGTGILIRSHSLLRTCLANPMCYTAIRTTLPPKLYPSYLVKETLLPRPSTWVLSEPPASSTRR